MKPVVVTLTAGTLFAAAVLFAQAPAANPQSDDSAPIRAEVTRVNMLFAVTDKRGHFVTDLNRGDFQVFENKKPQQIMEFTSET